MNLIPNIAHLLLIAHAYDGYYGYEAMCASLMLHYCAVHAEYSAV